MASTTAMATTLLDDDDKLLRHTQGLRLTIVDQMMDAGKVPVTQEDRDLLMKAIDGLDKQTIAKKRLKVDANVGDAAKQAAEALAIMSQRLAGRNPFMVKPEETAEIERTIPSKFSKTDVVIAPGELDIGNDTRTFDEFAKEHDGKI